MYRVNSLFSGGGTFDHGAHLAGWQTVSLCEYNEQAQAVLRHRLPGVPLHSDIRTLNGADLPDAEVLMGGSPCQSLSVAGKRAGIRIESLEEYEIHKNDPQLAEEISESGLFWEMIRVIKEKRHATADTFPRIALWENVPGAFSSHGGRDFAIVLRAFLEIGARDVAWRVLDSQFHGVPQRRRRIFLVADFGGECAAEILFKPEGVRRDSAPRRKAGQDAATASARGIDGHAAAVDVRNLVLGREVSGTLQAKNGGGYSLNYINPVMVPAFDPARALLGKAGWRGDGESDNFVVALPALVTSSGPANALTTGQNGQGTGLGSPRGDGADNLVVDTLPIPIQDGREVEKRQNGLGVGQPGDPAYTLDTLGAQVVAFDTTQITSPLNRSHPKPGDPCHPLTAGGNPPTIAILPVGADSPLFQDLTPVRGDGADNLVVDAPAPPYCVNQNGSDVQISPLAGCLTTGVARHTSGPLAFHLTQDPISGPISPCLTAGTPEGVATVGVATPYTVRRLTPTECERLQSVPDGWTAVPWKGGVLPDSARYRILGNGGTSVVLEQLFRRIEAALNRKTLL